MGGVKIRLGGTIPVSANPLPSSTHTNSVPMQNSFAKHITITHCSGFLRGGAGSTLTVSLTVKRHFFSRRLPEEFDVIVIIQNVWEATGT